MPGLHTDGAPLPEEPWAVNLVSLIVPAAVNGAFLPNQYYDGLAWLVLPPATLTCTTTACSLVRLGGRRLEVGRVVRAISRQPAANSHAEAWMVA